MKCRAWRPIEQVVSRGRESPTSVRELSAERAGITNEIVFSADIEKLSQPVLFYPLKQDFQSIPWRKTLLERPITCDLACALCLALRVAWQLALVEKTRYPRGWDARPQRKRSSRVLPSSSILPDGSHLSSYERKTLCKLSGFLSSRGISHLQSPNRTRARILRWPHLHHPLSNSAVASTGVNDNSDLSGPVHL